MSRTTWSGVRPWTNETHCASSSSQATSRATTGSLAAGKPGSEGIAVGSGGSLGNGCDEAGPRARCTLWQKNEPGDAESGWSVGTLQPAALTSPTVTQRPAFATMRKLPAWISVGQLVGVGDGVGAPADWVGGAAGDGVGSADADATSAVEACAEAGACRCPCWARTPAPTSTAKTAATTRTTIHDLCLAGGDTAAPRLLRASGVARAQVASSPSTTTMAPLLRAAGFPLTSKVIRCTPAVRNRARVIATSACAVLL